MVDHLHIARVQLRHTASHQVDDGADLLRRHLVARCQLQHHRGLARFALAHHERTAFLQRQVHACALDPLERHHRAGQLALQAALEAYVLDELAGTQRLILVEQLVAGRHLDLYALGCQQHARTAELILAHQHLAALRMQAIGDGVAVEHLHHFGCRIGLTRAVQRAERALVTPEVEDHADRQQRGEHRQAEQGHARIEFQAAFGQLAFDGLQHASGPRSA